uniref:NAC domain-containing protein n=1 Tax=Ascaris lumbricoides TaxID=6252 RepID=A0A0M3I8Y2_ASCLU
MEHILDSDHPSKSVCIDPIGMNTTDLFPLSLINDHSNSPQYYADRSSPFENGSFIQSSLDSSSDVYWCARSTEISNNSGTSTSAQLRLQPQLMDEKILHVSDTANVATINSENIYDATNVDVNSISNEFDSDSSNVRSDGNISKDIARMELEMLDDELAYFDNWILL